MKVLAELRESGVVSSLDVRFAESMAGISHCEEPDVLVAAALLSRQVRAGHVCWDLRGETLQSLELPSGTLGFPTPSEWLKTLASSPLVSDGSTKTPLVLDSDGKLYLHRYWTHEQVLAQYIKNAAAQLVPVDAELLNDGLERLFGAKDLNEPNVSVQPHRKSARKPLNDQRLAAFMAVRRRFCVVSGGPGTGKTYTVVNILALLIEQAIYAERPVPRISLVAPTGKAAARLVESIKKAKRNLPCSQAVLAAIPETASTVHRCLKTVAGSTTRFYHNPQTPLTSDVVLVDEASMVNLGLMRRLVDALTDKARLILLGDMNQLASVEAGAVLGDICNTQGTRHFSHAFAHDLFSLTEEQIPCGEENPTETGIWDCVAQLNKSYRFSHDSGIARLAKAVNAGDSDGALEALQICPELSLFPPATPGTLSKELQAECLDGYSRYLKATGSPVERLSLFDEFRVLCPRRTGPFGVLALNPLLVRCLSDAGLIRPDDDFFDGRPVLVTENDYQLKLFNGDVGLVALDRDTQSKRVYFVDPDGTERSVVPGRLRACQTVYAMSVHKSQGSEFAHVAIVLPDAMSPVMTRELLYTAVTRARKSVTIHGTAALIAQTIGQRTERSSGLRRALWGKAS